MSKPKIIVIGGGLAGLMTTIKIAELGGAVDLFSVVPVKRSHSVCAQGGINAAKNTKGEGDSVEYDYSLRLSLIQEAVEFNRNIPGR